MREVPVPVGFVPSVLRIPIRGYETAPANAIVDRAFVTNPYKGL